MKERLEKIIDYYGLTKTSFSQKSNIKEGTIRKILKENTTIRSDNLLKISQSFAEINLDWLITGRGEMLLAKRQENISFDKLFEINQQLNQQIGELRNEITHLEQENNELKKRLVPSQPTAAAQ